MTKEELINYKEKLDKEYSVVPDLEESIGLGKKRIINVRRDVRTEEFIKLFDVATSSIILLCAQNDHSLSHLDVDFRLTFITTRDKQNDFYKDMPMLGNMNPEQIRSYLNNNFSRKYFLCNVLFAGNDYIKDMYYYNRDNMVVEGFIDIDEFLSLMKKKGYIFTLDGSEVRNVDDIINYSSYSTFGIADLSTSICFTKTKEDENIAIKH